jgi:hypothetical protein
VVVDDLDVGEGWLEALFCFDYGDVVIDNDVLPLALLIYFDDIYSIGIDGLILEHLL